jgi:L-rhamnose isomerase
MIDQSHNLKGKIEAMVQTVVTAQELFAKAALVDREPTGSRSPKPPHLTMAYIIFAEHSTSPPHPTNS